MEILVHSASNYYSLLIIDLEMSYNKRLGPSELSRGLKWTRKRKGSTGHGGISLKMQLNCGNLKLSATSLRSLYSLRFWTGWWWCWWMVVKVLIKWQRRLLGIPFKLWIIVASTRFAFTRLLCYDSPLVQEQPEEQVGSREERSWGV